MSRSNLENDWRVVPASGILGGGWVVLALLGVLGDREGSGVIRALILVLTVLLTVALAGFLLRVKLLARQGGRKVRLNKRKLSHLERRLLEERQRILRQLRQFDQSVAQTLQESDGDLSAYSYHMADQGTDAMEREQAFMLASDDARELCGIDVALHKLYSTPESYGLCEQCGAEISFERLDVLPYARLCIHCKELEEGGSADLGARSRRGLHKQPDARPRVA